MLEEKTVQKEDPREEDLIALFGEIKQVLTESKEITSQQLEDLMNTLLI